MTRARLADPLRRTIDEVVQSTTFDKYTFSELMDHLRGVADSIDQEHARRMENCRRSVRRDFANYLRSVIADYEKGVSRRNRNHAHRKVRLFESATGRTSCGNCGQSISPFDHFCRHCGVKLTGTDYEEEGS